MFLLPNNRNLDIYNTMIFIAERNKTNHNSK